MGCKDSRGRRADFPLEKSGRLLGRWLLGWLRSRCEEQGKDLSRENKKQEQPPGDSTATTWEKEFCSRAVVMANRSKGWREQQEGLDFSSLGSIY